MYYFFFGFLKLFFFFCMLKCSLSGSLEWGVGKLGLRLRGEELEGGKGEGGRNG